jgi:hypothetical protein
MKAEFITKNAIKLFPETDIERQLLESMRHERIQVSSSSERKRRNDKYELEDMVISFGQFGKIYD